MKKYLALLLVAILSLSLCVTAAEGDGAVVPEGSNAEVDESTENNVDDSVLVDGKTVSTAPVSPTYKTYMIRSGEGSNLLFSYNYTNNTWEMEKMTLTATEALSITKDEASSLKFYNNRNYFPLAYFCQLLNIERRSDTEELNITEYEEYDEVYKNTKAELDKLFRNLPITPDAIDSTLSEQRNGLQYASDQEKVKVKDTISLLEEKHDSLSKAYNSAKSKVNAVYRWVSAENHAEVLCYNIDPSTGELKKDKYILKNNCVITRNGDPIADEKDESKYKDNMPIILDGRTYVPLRVLELFGIEVGFDSDSCLVVFSNDPSKIETITDNNNNETKEISKVAMNQATQAYASFKKLDYLNYSNIYIDNDKNPVVVPNTYGINHFNNFLVYVNSELRPCIKTIDADSKEIILDTSAYFDSVIFDGLNMYGIKTENNSDFSGNIVSGRLTSVADPNELCLFTKSSESTESKSPEYTTIFSGKARSLMLDGNYLYYCNEESENKLFRIKVNPSTGNAVSPDSFEPVCPTEATNVFSYSINPVISADNTKHLIFGDYNQHIKLVTFNNSTGVASKTTTLFDNLYMRAAAPNCDFGIANAPNSNDIFYFITETQDGKNELYRVYIDGSEIKKAPLDIGNTHKFRNPVYLNHNLYVTVDGKTQNIPLGTK